MSDNEDLLGDDLGDQSLADYNLGNEEEEQLLADDYEHAAPQNVPTSIGPGYRETLGPPDYPNHIIEYNNQQSIPYRAVVDTECVVPNITVELPNAPLPEHPTYAPYEPPVYEEHAVPPAIPAAPIESPQIVPSDIHPLTPNGDLGGPRERFVSERPPGAQRLPQVRDIPDSLDKVVIPVGAGGAGVAGRGRTSWRNPALAPRYSHQHPHQHQHQHQHQHPYRRNNMHRGNFNQRASFPPPQVRHNPPQIRPDIRPEMRPEIHHEIRPDMPPEMRPELRPEMPPQIRPDMRLEPPNLPQMGPEISPERPILPQDMPMYRPPMERPQFLPRFHYRPPMEERPQFGPMRPNFEPRQMFFRPSFPPRQFAPPMREIAPNASHIPQVTIRQAIPMPGPSLDKLKEPEVRMLPVPLPANLPPGGLAGKKVLINPHFKGNFQPPVEGLPVYIPTRIQKSPPLSPTIENKFGPVNNIDDAAERFIAEQRNALARAAVRKYSRRSPQRYIENTTIEIENDLAHSPHRRRSNDDDDLLRRQEEFINANRAGLRRRMRSPSPCPSPVAGRRSVSPRRSPERRRPEPARHSDEDSEYKRRLREQENLRERVLRAKEVRRRKNAVALHKQLQDKERETQEKEKEAQSKPGSPPAPVAAPSAAPGAAPSAAPCAAPAVAPAPAPAARSVSDIKPDTTRRSPDTPRPTQSKTVNIVRERSPIKDDTAEVNSTCENLTPPHKLPIKRESPERGTMTPPLPDKKTDSDDDLDLILGDIDGILSDDEDTGRFKEKTKKSESTKSKPQVDLRSKLPPKTTSADHKKAQRQKIVFTEDKDEGKTKKRVTEKSPPRRAVVTSSTKTEDTEPETKKIKVKAKLDTSVKSRQRITYEKEQAEKEEEKKSAFSNRRVILQRKAPKEKSVFSRIEVKTDPSKPNPGIFSRAVRTAIGTESTRIVVKKEEPQVQFESDSDIDEDTLLEDSGNIATVGNLPHGMTDTRLKTLAGSEVQSLILDKEERSAKITFKTTIAAENFKKKFNNKMVAASRLSVTLR